MSWQRVCLSLKSYVVDIDDQEVACCHCRVVLVMELPSHVGDVAAEATMVVACHTHF
jgi:hypothetical protein